MRTVYLDNNATTQVAPEVTEAMMPFFNELWGNPSSMHYFGGQVAKYVEEARAKLAALLGAEPSEIVFTSCGTESDNTAIKGALNAVIIKRLEKPQQFGCPLRFPVSQVFICYGIPEFCLD